MFRVTRASLKSFEGEDSIEADSLVISDPSTAVNGLKIIRKFEFTHKHAYMSVVVKDTISGKKYVFLKGKIWACNI
jgi:magnesium-transporting ATPase (P-type)